MFARSSSINPSSALKQFGLFFAMFAAAVVLATITAMISANPGSRRLEGMVYDRGSERAISGVVTGISLSMQRIESGNSPSAANTRGNHAGTRGRCAVLAYSRRELH